MNRRAFLFAIPALAVLRPKARRVVVKLRDFGRGTRVRLHGSEVVFTEEEINRLFEASRKA